MPQEFAANVFHFELMEKSLPAKVFRQFRHAVDQKEVLPPEVAEALAGEIKKWALGMQVTHYTHWFLPLTGLTAGKQNNFLEHNGQGRPLNSFSGRDLIKGEPDASSFPHGGMRSTFEARGYTHWDPSSPVFIMKTGNSSVLYIPSVFYGYNGKVLDKKTPLLRSLRLINRVSLELSKKLGRKASWVRNMVGLEQEFFLIRESDYCLRPDLRNTGRLIFGARPARGQQMGDHYFGSIPGPVLEFLDEVEDEAFKLGIPVKTRHNEVAPNQFEIAPLYEEANIACDHNQMLMELLTQTARRHRMVCLLHEKPFPFFNGSGKHLNWSLQDNRGLNLFSPPESRSGRLVFFAFLSGFITGICRHQEIIQAVLASAGNELRLGGHEAPPAIVSVYLGQGLQEILRDPEAFLDCRGTAAGRRSGSREFISLVRHDGSDRNRTSPIAFTGNKFEFRLPGSSASLAFPLAAINMVIADGLAEVSALLQEGKERENMARLSRLCADHSQIIFEGDNYSQSWREQARQRKLHIPASLPAAINLLRSPANTALFTRHNLLSAEEVEARALIKIEMYVKSVEMELRVARQLLRTAIVPAALKYQHTLLSAIRDYPDRILAKKPNIIDQQYRFIEKWTEKINLAMDYISLFDEDNEKLKNASLDEKAEYCSTVIRPRLAEAAVLAEKIEERVDMTLWPLPKVSALLFR